MLLPPTRTSRLIMQFCRLDFYFQQQTAEGVRKSITFLQDAVRLDPNYALAYAKLGQAWRQSAVSFAIDDASKAYDEAREAADKAVKLAPDLVEARMIVGLLALTPGLDFPAGERDFRRVLQSSPNNAAAKNALCMSLLAQGRLTEAEDNLSGGALVRPSAYHFVVRSRPNHGGDRPLQRSRGSFSQGT